MRRLYKRLYRQSCRWHNLLNWTVTLSILIGLLYLFYGYLPDVRPDQEAILAEVEQFQLRVESYGLVAPVAFVVIYAVANSLFTPGMVLSIAGGLIFGFGPGLFLCLLGLSLSSQTYYWVAKFAGKPFIKRFGREEWKLFQREDSMKPTTILSFRTNYFIPFHAFNAACGTMNLPLRRYLGFTVLGMVPPVAAGAYLGTALVPDSGILVLAITVWVGVIVGRIMFGIWHMKHLVSKRTSTER